MTVIIIIITFSLGTDGLPPDFSSLKWNVIFACVIVVRAVLSEITEVV
jgi:hypothetical protein